MLKRAALPLLRPRHLQPLIRQALPQLRYYSRDQGIKGSDYKIPGSQGDTSSQSREPLRKIPFTPTNPAPKNEPAPETPPFGEDPTKDVDDVSNSVSKATRRSMRDQHREAASQEAGASVQPESSESRKPQQPLPDLTKGIPSTLDAELSQTKPSKAKEESHAQRSSLNITEDPEEEVPGGGGRSDGDAPREQYVSSSDRKRNAILKYMYSVLGVSVLGYSLYLGRNWETEEEEKKYADAPSGWGLGLFYDRVKARLGSTMSYYRDPVSPKLLPDENPDPNLRYPFTLVFSLEDMLIHSEWTREHGWRTAKRPGLDYFLRYLGSYYELVLFTSQPMATAELIIRKLDPYSTIHWPLFREATLYKDGGYVKDLSYLNRDLKKVLIIDTDSHHVKNQPENAIILPKWTGDPKDQTLIQLIPFLEYLATMGFDDVREVLKSFDGTNIPVEFARREKILREKFAQQEAEKRKGKKGKTIGGLASALGLSKSNPDEGSSGEGKMLWDEIRERGQKQYMEFERKIKEEGEKWLADRDAEEKRLQEEAMKNMRTGWFSGFLGGGKAVEEPKK
ncbi:hypothetical protein PV11_02608 [Exophiala sideris]|uniref:Mitochondrial import inner membrane translocase subunit TIM50 n=1 Tax=Exophiala sideris TaxID=1016849 RepID=A0A0D1YWY4_9EURO|nr:hypothetical protein PV11_02608 [Exophiala sideris]